MSVTAGGPVANVGRVLTELGVDLHLTGNIGPDSFGAILERLSYETCGVHHSLAVVEGTGTSFTIVIQPPGKDRTYWHYAGANAHFDGTTVDVSKGDLLHLGYPSSLPALMEQDGRPLKALMVRARAAEVTTSLDLSYIDPRSWAAGIDWASLFADLLPLIDVISPSIDDLSSAFREEHPKTLGGAAAFARRLVRAGVGVAMVTAGPAGLVVATAGQKRLRQSRVLTDLATQSAEQLVAVPASPTANAQTLGAGDAATGGLLFGLLAGLDLLTTANCASAAATQSVQRNNRGSRPSDGQADHWRKWR
jgi:Sugar kinases, ribokinase family